VDGCTSSAAGILAVATRIANVDAMGDKARVLQEQLGSSGFLAFVTRNANLEITGDAAKMLGGRW